MKMADTEVCRPFSIFILALALFAIHAYRRYSMAGGVEVCQF